jgi:hypothetical protein
MMGLRLCLGSMIASVVLLAGFHGVSAEVQVDGRPEAVHLEAHDASLREVLAALHDRFNLRYRSDDALDTPATGVFDGPLRRIAARILAGYDYAMTITPQGIEVLVMRQHQTAAARVMVVAASAVRPPPTAAERKHYEQGHLR